jgi:hypothetical protein
MGIGDCAAVALVPTSTGGSFEFRVLYQPVEYQVPGVPNLFRPASFVSTVENDRDRAVNYFQLPEHSVLVLMTDGCWSKFSTGSQIKSRFLEDGTMSKLLEYTLDPAPFQHVLSQLSPAQRVDAHEITSHLRQYVLRRSEAHRWKLHDAVRRLHAFRTSSAFERDRDRFVTEDPRGRKMPLPWSRRASVLDALPPEVLDACLTFIESESFSEDVPILSLLEYQPVWGDDSSILVHVLTSWSGAAVRSLLDACSHGRESATTYWLDHLFRRGLSPDDVKHLVHVEQTKQVVDTSSSGAESMSGGPPTIIVPTIGTSSNSSSTSEKETSAKFYTRRLDQPPRTMNKYPPHVFATVLERIRELSSI